MRQAIMVAPGKIEFQDVPAPAPGAGEVLLRIRRIGVCGSDVHVNHGKHPFTSYPVVQGHEFSATVESLGSGVEDIEVGELVTATPQVVCGQCGPCSRGDYHICDALKVEGFQAPGCAQDLFVTTADKIVKLPRDFTLEQGAMVEPVSVAVHAVDRAGDIAGKNVVVLGAGPIGNLVGQVARANGATVLITDVSDFRLGIARECGLPFVSNSGQEPLRTAAERAFGGRGFEVALECAGVEPTIEAAIQNVAKGGTIVVVSVFGERPRVSLGLVQDRELTLKGTLMYQRRDYLEAVKWIASGGVVTRPLETTHFQFADYMAAYRFIDEHRDETLKVFVDLTP